MQIGATYFTDGLNMNCRRTVVQVKLVEVLETPIVHPGRDGRPDTVFNCVTESKGRAGLHQHRSPSCVCMSATETVQSICQRLEAMPHRPIPTLQVLIRPGATFRGITYFEETRFDVSTMLAWFVEAQKLGSVVRSPLTASKMEYLCKQIGCTVRTVDGEIRVNLRGAGEDSTYYTSDRWDAVDTAVAMARRAGRVF